MKSQSRYVGRRNFYNGEISFCGGGVKKEVFLQLLNISTFIQKQQPEVFGKKKEIS